MDNANVNDIAYSQPQQQQKQSEYMDNQNPTIDGTNPTSTINDAVKVETLANDNNDEYEQHGQQNYYNTNGKRRHHSRGLSFIGNSNEHGYYNTGHDYGENDIERHNLKINDYHRRHQQNHELSLPPRSSQQTLHENYNGWNSHNSNRQRLGSDEMMYNHHDPRYQTVPHQQQASSGTLKFYESDFESPSLILSSSYRGHNRYDSLGSPNSYFHHMGSPQNHQFAQYHQQRQHQYNYADHNTNNYFFDNSHINNKVLPYQKRKQLQQGGERSMNNKNDHNNSQQNYDQHNNKLSTIGAPYIKQNLSPQQYPSSSNYNRLPPTHGSNKNSNSNQRANIMNRNRTYSEDSNDNDSPPRSDNDSPPHRMYKNQQHQQLPPHPNHKLPRNPQHVAPTRTLHIRTDSTGSISSLGSITGGASLISQSRELPTDRKNIDSSKKKYLRGKDFDDDEDNKMVDNNENVRKSRGHRNTLTTGSGFLSSILGSVSMTSDGSVNSIDNETAEFHEKNQKFLKKTEQDKARQAMVQGLIENGRNMLPDFGRSSMRSLSPGSRSQRSHRPRLPSIDNDDWAEGGDHQGGSLLRKSASKHSHAPKRPPKSQKQAKKNYGATSNNDIKSQQVLIRGRKGYDNGNLDKLTKIRNSKQQEYYSESASDSVDSPISSDFTSNQKDERYNDDDSQISSDFTSNQKGDDADSSSDNASADGDNHFRYDYYLRENEKTSLLQPHGISTGETNNRPLDLKGQPRNIRAQSRDRGYRQYETKNNRKMKKSKAEKDSLRKNNTHNIKSHQRYHYYDDNTDSDSSDERHVRFEEGRIKGRYGNEKELRALRAEIEKLRRREEERHCCKRLNRRIDTVMTKAHDNVAFFLSDLANFISNIPLTIGAIALATVTLGIAWFKFAEEMSGSCRPVHFHSSQCTFSEFPGCFYCDTSTRIYEAALTFHLACSTLAGMIVMVLVIKIFIARDVVLDEMNSPTTASPAGLICMTLVLVFAGKGLIGEVVVTVAATLHFCIAVWFIHMAGAYNILPDPSWYPNTVGIGLSALKMWMYHPMPGHLLMATCLTLYAFFFPISLVRVTLNKKLSAPVSWIQMSAPAAALCSLTIMAQPSFSEEYPDITQFQRVHRMLYLPVMHFLFATCLIGAVSSVHSLTVRWEGFIQKKFSPAHAAFCFPTLSHANAIQSYRSAIIAFSDLQSNEIFMRALNIYWIIALSCGSLITVVITTKFFYMLPSWTKVDVENEPEPPAPSETIMSEVILAGQTLRQNFVSPAVLQANEAGVLVRVPGHRGARARYARTRNVTALGFEPIMDLIELNTERDKLLEYVAKNPPRQRTRTLSVPGITAGIANFGVNNRGVYGSGMPPPTNSADRRARAQTIDGNHRFYNYL